ncbi:MAG: hypothetical protein ACLTXR_08960 [Clostridia bacterium]
MGAYTFLSGKKIKFWRVSRLIAEDEPYIITDLQIGNIAIEKWYQGQFCSLEHKDGLFIKATNGILEVTRNYKVRNAKKMNILDFLRGNQSRNQEIFLNRILT